MKILSNVNMTLAIVLLLFVLLQAQQSLYLKPLH